MPIYEAMCKKCTKYHTYFQTVAHYLDTPECCGEKTHKLISAPMLQTSTFRVFENFESPSTGKVITSMRQRTEDMKVSGCREWEGFHQEKKEAARRAGYEDEKFDKKIESWLGEEIQKLPAEQRQVLTGI